MAGGGRSADGVVCRLLAFDQVRVDSVSDAAVGPAVGRVAFALPRQQRSVAQLLAEGAGPLDRGGRISGGTDYNYGGFACVFNGSRSGPDVLVGPISAVRGTVSEEVSQRRR